MDAVFHALAHAHRRHILDLLVETPGMTVGEIAGHFETSRVAVSKHLAQLEAAELLTTVREGREKRHYFNVIPIQRIHERWTDRYSRFLAPKLTAFARAVEAEYCGEASSEEQVAERKAGDAGAHAAEKGEAHGDERVRRRAANEDH